MADRDDPALEALRFPIGRFEPADAYGPQDVAENLARLAVGPRRLKSAVRGLSAAQLDTPYRPGGWSARQVVHHLADSALNGSLRFRWALTEDEPSIKPYDEARWAQLPDALRAPIEPSLELFEHLCTRWVALLGSLGPGDWARRFHHPEAGVHVRLDAALALYAWHGEHHCSQISSLRSRARWG